MLRQVAHALLTRPPLSYLHSIRRLPSNNSVRLECVMHAASVHPEPGSNSRSIVLKSLPKKCSNLSSFFLASFTFCLSSILLRISNEISFALYFFSLCTSSISCCSIFNDQFRCPSMVTASLLYHIRSPFVKYFFQLFKTFFVAFLPPAFATLLYYHISLHLSIPFLKFFKVFFKKF